MLIERRFGKREAVHLRARVIGENGDIEVTVRDYSYLGCRLVTSGPARIPASFTLRYLDSNLPDVEAEMVWQRGNEVGVKFSVAEERIAPKQTVSFEARRFSVDELRAMTRRTGSA